RTHASGRVDEAGRDLQIRVPVVIGGEIDTSAVLEQLGLDAPFIFQVGFRFERRKRLGRHRAGLIDAAAAIAVRDLRVEQNVGSQLIVPRGRPGRLLEGSLEPARALRYSPWDREILHTRRGYQASARLR